MYQKEKIYTIYYSFHSTSYLVIAAIAQSVSALDFERAVGRSILTAGKKVE